MVVVAEEDNKAKDLWTGPAFPWNPAFLLNYRFR
jgi:hypothetical protein